jgi:hypothetical protein
VTDDLLRVEYGQTTDFLRSLTDVRFKLLTFVPTIAGTAVALLGRHTRPAELLAVGALGLAATFGIVLYELHNTLLYEYALGRAEELEAKLGLGLYTSRPHYAHDRPLAIVYAVVVGAWMYLVAWGALAAASVGDAQVIGGLVAAAVAIAAAVELDRARWKAGPAAAGPAAVTSSGS